MRRVRIIHWKAVSAGPLVDAVRVAGFQADYEPDLRPTHIGRAIRESAPVAIIIDLNFRPAMGRDVGAHLRGIKHCRNTPLVFVDGEAEKVEEVRRLLPDAVFARVDTVGAALQSLAGDTLENPVVPPPFMERYKGRTVAQKLGIEPGSAVALVDPPPNYPAVLGELPEDVELDEEPETARPVTLLFVHDGVGLLEGARRLRKLALNSKSWLAWRKDAKNGVNQNSIRQTCAEFGLVDYKICALDGKWSAMLFARRKE